MVDENNILNRIQNRINAEDSLLHSRTTIFLLTNGLLLATLGIESYGRFRLVFCILGILVSVVWTLVGWQSWRIIREFHIEREERFPDAIEVQVSKKALPKHSLIRITDLLSRCLPWIFIIIWIISSALIFSIGYR